MKTYFATSENIENKWYVVDASGEVLGRLASQIAKYLRGKHKPEYTPHADAGDYVVVVNAEKVRVTGNKSDDKVYYTHSGYPSGLKEVTFDKLQAKDATKAIELAVKGMMPKNPLGREMLRKLKVYAGDYVVVVNAEKVRVTGNKSDDKVYYSFFLNKHLKINKK